MPLKQRNTETGEIETVKAKKPTKKAPSASKALVRGRLMELDAEYGSVSPTSKRSERTASHLVIKAGAGCGKTTTLLGGLDVLKDRTPINGLKPSVQQRDIWDAIKEEDPQTIRFTAFNKSIATELARRVPPGVEACTNHSFGFSVLREDPRFKYTKVSGYKTVNALEAITKKTLSEMWKSKIEVGSVERLVSFCKVNLVELTSDNAMELLGNMAAVYDIPFTKPVETSEFVLHCLKAATSLTKSPKGGREYFKEIDFDDMIWLPIALDLPIKKVDLLMVDECQDLNRAQQELAFRSANRLVFCGDEHQAIYAFAGADAESMERLTTRLDETPRGCLVLPLNQTRRCGLAIVKEANQIVPDFYAHPSNPEGEVKRIPVSVFTSTVKSEDMVLCRTNAPLVSYCFKLLKEGRKARIQGRDIGEGLISLIRKMRVDTIPEFEEAFEKWFGKEETKLLAKKRVPESALIALYDKKDCLLTFAENSDTVEDMIAYIEKVFSDVAGPGVLLSSIHRAKGLESDTVFLLSPHLIPHPMAKSEQAQEQEWNLKYTAITRAINTLIYVDAPEGGVALQSSGRGRGSVKKVLADIG